MHTYNYCTIIIIYVCSIIDRKNKLKTIPLRYYHLKIMFSSVSISVITISKQFGFKLYNIECVCNK